MVKVRCPADKRHDILAVVDIFKGKVVDTGVESMIIMLTGNQQKLDQFLRLITDFEVLELARTGVTGLMRGADDVVFL